MPSKTPRRVVTGHDAHGVSVFLSDDATPSSQTIPGGHQFFELWSTADAPALITAAEDEPTKRALLVPPPRRGTLVRIVEFPARSSSPRHRTETIDYGIVLSGTIVVVLDDSETELFPGDTIIQRGTDHRWDNRSNHPARMAFILIDGQFAPELRASLPAGAATALMRDPRQPD